MTCRQRSKPVFLLIFTMLETWHHLDILMQASLDLPPRRFSTYGIFADLELRLNNFATTTSLSLPRFPYPT